MGTEYPGRGDLVRSLELLWGIHEDQVKRGPKPQLTVEQIADAAIELADAEGFEGLSMRRVADRLGVGTMSLYRYVPDKAELLDLMVDRVSGETDRTSRRRGWRSRLEHIARENRRLYESHPWLLQVFPGRPSMGPGILDKYDHELRSVEGIGLSDVEMDLVLTVVLGYVRGAVLSLIETAHLRERTGRDDMEWWEAIEPTLMKVIDEDRFPLATCVGMAASAHYMAASAPELVFEFGLKRVLDGIGVLVEQRRGR